MTLGLIMWPLFQKNEHAKQAADAKPESNITPKLSCCQMQKEHPFQVHSRLMSFCCQAAYERSVNFLHLSL